MPKGTVEIYDQSEMACVSREYNKSKTEVLLEEMCESFGTKLPDGEIILRAGTAILTRMSDPAFLVKKSEREGESRTYLLLMQYSRFSMLKADINKLYEVYSKNTPKKSQVRSANRFEDWLVTQMGADGVRHINDSKLVPEINLHRFPKALYFAAYDVTGRERFSHALTHPCDTRNLAQLTTIYEVFPIVSGEENIFPELYLTLSISPIFVVQNHREPTTNLKDRLTIRYPAAEIAYRNLVRLAADMHMQQAQAHEHVFVRDIEFPVNTPREATLGYIYTMLNKFCRGRTF